MYIYAQEMFDGPGVGDLTGAQVKPKPEAMRPREVNWLPEYRSLLDQYMVESIAPELFFWRFFLHHQLLIKVFFYVQVGWLLVLDFLATW